MSNPAHLFPHLPPACLSSCLWLENAYQDNFVLCYPLHRHQRDTLRHSSPYCSSPWQQEHAQVLPLQGRHSRITGDLDIPGVARGGQHQPEGHISQCQWPDAAAIPLLHWVKPTITGVQSPLELLTSMCAHEALLLWFLAVMASDWRYSQETVINGVSELVYAVALSYVMLPEARQCCA